jgi:cytochrome c-type protein NapC
VLKEKWSALQARCKTCSRVTLSLGVAFAVLFVTGGLLAAGAAGLAWTNTESFCTSCHEMRDNVFAEYQGTIHASNRSGVRAICSDCHVPRDPGPLLVAKIKATSDLYHHLIGSIDTKEKFEAKRHELATNVWRGMKENDSLPCRNCHVESAMSSDLQTERAQSQHAKGKAEGKTCIDCHYGIAHNEPEGPGPQEMKLE